MSNFTGFDDRKGGAPGRGTPGLSPHVGPNGNWFVGSQDTGVKAAGGMDTSELKPNDIPKWDPIKQKLVASGVKSDQAGELMIAPSSILFGNHSMSAAIENVAFRNDHSHRVYAPLWQEMAPGQDVGYIRAYDATIEKVVRVPDGSINVTNPVNEAVTIDKDEIFLGGTFTLDQDATNLMLQIFDHGTDDLIWQQRLGDQVAGKKSITFKIPFDVRAGYQYDIKLISEDGSDVVAKSNAATGFSWTINRAGWEDLPIASQKWVSTKLAALPQGGGDISQAITHVSLVGSQLTFTHGDGAKHVVTLPAAGGGATAQDIKGLRDSITVFERDLTQKGADILALQNKYGQIEHQITSLSGTYSYDGTSLPAYPDDPKHSYFIHLHGTAARIIDLNLPNPTNGQPLDGSMYVLGNANEQANVRLSPVSGQTIEGQQSINIPPTHYVVLVKSGTNWVKIIDSSLTAQQVPMAITPDQITKALDRGTFTGTGSIKTLQPGWWVIPESNKGVSGRPKGSTGDLVVYKARVGAPPGSGRPQYGVNLAFGQDSDGNNQAWAEYRIPSGWTPWFPMYQADGTPPELGQIQQDITTLKSGQATNLQSITQLQTDLGNVFAPSKSAFDTEANRLISAVTSPMQASIQSLGDKQAKMTDTIETALKAKGWGPLPKAPGQGGGGGDHHVYVLPKIVAMFHSGIPTSLSDNSAVTSTNGKATLHRIPTTPMRIWVLVENDNDEASKVKTISVNGGMPAAWQPRDLVFDGHKYRGFYSAGAYTETDVEIQVNFG